MSEDVKAVSERFLANLDEWVLLEMTKLGMAPREIKAELAKVPVEIKRELPIDAVKSMLAGNRPAAGFGIGGNTGGGKTMALASILKEHLKGVARLHSPAVGIVHIVSVEWVCWPDEVNALRSKATHPDTPARLERIQKAPILFLDDLGRERIKGNYADDWAASQLDGIINHRYRHEMPTFWTTNITIADLVALYGAAMVSRLTDDNPLIWINDLKNMRGKLC